MAVKQPVAIILAFDPDHDRRFDDTDLADGRFDLSIFDGFLDRRRHRAQHFDVTEWNAQARRLEGELDLPVSWASGHWRLILTF